MTGPQAVRVAFDVLPLAGPPTGVGVACDQLLRALTRRHDVDVSAFAVARRAGRLAALLPPGTDLRALPLPTRVAFACWRISGFPSAESLAGAASVLHGTNFVVPPARRIATVVTVNDVTPWKYPELCAPASLAYPRLVERAVRRGAFVHTAAHQVAAELATLVAVPEDRVRVIPYGLAPAPPPDTGGIRPVPVAGPYVLAISTIEPRKDYPTLVHAFAQLAPSHPELKLVIAGAEGRASPALDAAVSETHLHGRVVRLGYVEDSVRTSLLAGARAFAYPSIYEGFGFPPLEAMAAGVPVVATAGGAVPEIVGDGAVVVPVGDRDALAGALGRLVDDEDARAEAIARGRARAAQFSWAATAEAMVRLYREAAGDR